MNLRNVDLNLLVVLDALLSERNVSRAAQRIGLSQSAMSAALARLREVFHDHSLVRVGRGLALTRNAGRSYRPNPRRFKPDRAGVTPTTGLRSRSRCQNLSHFCI